MGSHLECISNVGTRVTHESGVNDTLERDDCGGEKEMCYVWHDGTILSGHSKPHHWE